VYIKGSHRTYYSKSFGALGCGLGKAIGVYYATRKPVLCFVGDQGLQINIQELQFIGQHKLPIMIVLINNSASGMIRDRELSYRKFLHTTKNSGFGSPNYKSIAEAYDLNYYLLNEEVELDSLMSYNNLPKLVEMCISEDLSLTPNLPKGAKCQDMQPALAKEKYEYLNAL
jgi:acetolactate synthase-1/2/3 large subunit